MLNHKIIPQNSTLIIGFSGGPDSVYLLLKLKALQKKLNLTLLAAHLDHEWRPESTQEAEWCKQFCKNHDITFISTTASKINFATKYNGSKEAHARQLRRAFFTQLASKYNNSKIALAHHKDDQIETFFIRLTRGASLRGLTGIKEQDSCYIRPLLQITKSEILTYLKKNKISYLTDPSNQDQAHLRNRIRQQLTYHLTDIDHRLPNSIIKTMQHLTQVDNLLQNITHQTLQKISCPQSQQMLDIKQFLDLNPIVQQQILMHLLIQANAHFTPSQALFAEIIRFLRSQKHQSHKIHATYKIQKDNNRFYITQQ